MTLQTIINAKLSTHDLNIIATELGYHSPVKLLSRIRKIINSSYLSLDRGTYDFHNNTPSFIGKLCDALNIPRQLYETVIAETLVFLDARAGRFKPYIFIDTNFKRKNQSLIMLQLSNRRIPIDPALHEVTLNEQIVHIQGIIKDHYRRHPTLPVWGKVDHYVYHYSEAIRVSFEGSGEVIP